MGNIDIMIVDKQNNLNIYKEDTRKVENDEDIFKPSCCSSNGTKAAEPVSVKVSACCGTIQDSSKPEKPMADTGSCCSTSGQKVKDATEHIIDIDFNEWVGK